MPLLARPSYASVLRIPDAIKSTTRQNGFAAQIAWILAWLWATVKKSSRRWKLCSDMEKTTAGNAAGSRLGRGSGTRRLSSCLRLKSQMHRQLLCICSTRAHSLTHSCSHSLTRTHKVQCQRWRWSVRQWGVGRGRAGEAGGPNRRWVLAAWKSNPNGI